MRTLDLGLKLYSHYGRVEEITHYYGLMAQYAYVQTVSEIGDEEMKNGCREMLMRFPETDTRKQYNFPCYYLGGNAAAWADMTGLCRRREGELALYADRTMAGPRGADGLLCMPGGEEKGQIWIDTLFAVVPFLLFAGRSLNQDRYVDFAADQCLRMAEALTDPVCGLLHQCRGFMSDPKACSQDHWSRGNGWGYAALAELCAWLPGEHPRRRRAEHMFRSLSAALVQYQSEHGLWRQEITEENAWEESSGTALILYGMGIGIRCGLLQEDYYLASFAAGINALVKDCIHPDGSTEKSCPGCLCPGEGRMKGTIQAYITEKQPVRDEHHSFGAFMLALLEAYRNGITDVNVYGEG